MELLHLMAEALIQYETIDRFQIDQIMEGKKAQPADELEWQAPQGSGLDRWQQRPRRTVPAPCSYHRQDGGSAQKT